jgi:hypothetical protein
LCAQEGTRSGRAARLHRAPLRATFGAVGPLTLRRPDFAAAEDGPGNEALS